jgi:hypothetical protein
LLCTKFVPRLRVSCVKVSSRVLKYKLDSCCVWGVRVCLCDSTGAVRGPSWFTHGQEGSAPVQRCPGSSFCCVVIAIAVATCHEARGTSLRGSGHGVQSATWSAPACPRALGSGEEGSDREEGSDGGGTRGDHGHETSTSTLNDALVVSDRVHGTWSETSCHRSRRRRRRRRHRHAHHRHGNASRRQSCGALVRRPQ